MEVISEGKAKFYASRDKTGKISKELEVFYNPVMKFNRDVSVLLLNAIDKKDMQIADIMAGSGVRSLRFILELNSGIIKNITINDNDKDFINFFKKNMQLNNIDYDSKSASEKIIVTNTDANKLLIDSVGFDYIDIDPFGSPNDFLENSITRLSRKSVLGVTATDTAPLCGTFPDAGIRKYWAKPLHNHLMHEVGLRILIRKVQLMGAQNDKALIPIFSYYKDHYFRIFFKCIKGKQECDKLFKEHKYFLYCEKCMNTKVSVYNKEICACGTEMIFSGPLWIGKLFDRIVAEKILTNAKIENYIDKSDMRSLELMYGESKLDIVGFYDVHAIAKKYKLQIPNYEKFIFQIEKQKHIAIRTHFTEYGIKTTMPLVEFIELLKK